MSGEFVSGLLTMGHLVAALFFFKFWARTRDALFAAFAIAFVLFAAEQALLAFSQASREERTWYYLLRLCGFVLIIIGIANKNRKLSGNSPTRH
jgi:hypothetical protein